MPLRHAPLWYLVSLALIGCGREGFDLMGSGSPLPIVDSGDGSQNENMQDGMAGAADAFVATCGEEQLLAAETSGGSGSTADVFFTQATVSFGPTVMSPRIGEDDPLPSGFSGITEYRASTYPAFSQVATGVTDGSNTTLWLGLSYYPDGNGGYSGYAIDPSLTGATITMIRRRVDLLVVEANAMRTSHELDVTWEMWGCP